MKEEANQCIKVHSGEAVFWETHEWHETKIETGLTGIVTESEEQTTSLFTPSQSS